MPQQDCESFLTERTKLTEIKDNLGKESEEYQEFLIKLKDMVCDSKERTVCCEEYVPQYKSYEGKQPLKSLTSTAGLIDHSSLPSQNYPTASRTQVCDPDSTDHSNIIHEYDGVCELPPTLGGKGTLKLLEDCETLGTLMLLPLYCYISLFFRYV